MFSIALPASFAELMPTSPPLRSISGPPLLPGLIAAVGLDQVIVSAIGSGQVVLRREAAMQRAQDAVTDRVLVPRRAAERDHRFAPSRFGDVYVRSK